MEIYLYDMNDMNDTPIIILLTLIYPKKRAQKQMKIVEKSE